MKISKPRILGPKPCPRCKHQDPPSAKFCMACSLPLRIPRDEAQEKHERAELERFTKQPEVLKELWEIG